MMPTGSYVGLVQNSRANNVRFLKYTLWKKEQLFLPIHHLFHVDPVRLHRSDAVLHHRFPVLHQERFMHHLHHETGDE